MFLTVTSFEKLKKGTETNMSSVTKGHEVKDGYIDWARCSLRLYEPRDRITFEAKNIYIYKHIYQISLIERVFFLYI